MNLRVSFLRGREAIFRLRQPFDLDSTDSGLDFILGDQDWARLALHGIKSLSVIDILDCVLLPEVSPLTSIVSLVLGKSAEHSQLFEDV